MTTARSLTALRPTEVADWHRDGFYVARGLFGPDEIAAIKNRFDSLAQRAVPVPQHWEPSLAAADVLGRYPRVMQPHAFDPATRDVLLDRRLHAILTDLMGDDIVACQTMYYFKPPGARGQAFHQDNYYLRVQPLSCVAAWIAVDPSHPLNGGLQVCPGTHTMEVECPELSDADTSFTTDFVPPPAGHEPVKLELEPGDVLFFNGSVVHGSNPNSTGDEWRRSLICHYMPSAATHISPGYQPYMLDFAGQPVSKEASVGGGPCGEEFSGRRVGRAFH
jgi:phytanoyl-CoA hydroxylase